MDSDGPPFLRPKPDEEVRKRGRFAASQIFLKDPIEIDTEEFRYDPDVKKMASQAKDPKPISI